MQYKHSQPPYVITVTIRVTQIRWYQEKHEVSYYIQCQIVSLKKASSAHSFQTRVEKCNFPHWLLSIPCLFHYNHLSKLN